MNTFVEQKKGDMLVFYLKRMEFIRCLPFLGQENVVVFLIYSYKGTFMNQANNSINYWLLNRKQFFHLQKSKVFYLI